MKSSGSESDFGDYLSNLQKKTVGNKFNLHIDGLSDLSLSDLSDKKENFVPPKSKFLKNTPKKTKSNKDVTKEVKPKKKKKEKKIKKQVNIVKVDKIPISKEMNNEYSDSDMNFSFSSSLKDSKPTKTAPSSVPKLELNFTNTKSKAKQSIFSEKSDDNDETSFGKDGHRFLKPKTETPDKKKQVEVAKTKTVVDDISLSREFSPSPRKSTLRSNRSTSNKKKVTIMESKHVDTLSSLDTELQNSFEEIMKSKSDSESDSEKNFYGLNIMSFKELVEDDIKEEIIEDVDSKPGKFKTFEKIMSIEELEDNDEVATEISESKFTRYSKEISETSEIKTLPNITPRKSINQSFNQSISEIISASQKESSENNSVSSKIYSTDFEDSKKENTQQFASVFKKSFKKSPSYSSDFTDEDPTIYSVPKNQIKEKKLTKQNKADVLDQQYPQNNFNFTLPPGLGKENVDSVPIAHYIVSPEVLESITAYSPTMLLMTNMYRQQIQMTTNFIETQKRLYESLLSSIRPTYQYSSLQEAKEFIKLNKSKPLTMKEALRMVETDQ